MLQAQFDKPIPLPLTLLSTQPHAFSNYYEISTLYVNSFNQ